jgi:hypothetical protein
MTRASQNLLIVVGVVALLAIAAAWSVNWMGEQRSAAAAALAELGESQRLADQIVAAQQRSMGTDEQETYRALAAQVEAARDQAALVPRVDIQPGASRRTGNSPYLVQPTALSLSGARLPQLLTFLYHLTHDSDLTVRDLRLRSPQRGDDQRWNADLTVTYLIYSPASNRPR